MDRNPKIETTRGAVAISTLPKSLSDSYHERMGKLLDLSKEQEARLKGWLKKRIDEWLADTKELHEDLAADNDLVEGYVAQTDFPYEGASNVHVPVTEMYMEVYKSVFKRSILGADNIWYGETDDDAMRDVLPMVEDAMNFFARNDWNIEKCVSQVFWTTCRDGLGVIQVTWAEEYQKARDIVLITSLDDFFAEFPTPEEAGIPEEDWYELASQAESASEEMPLEVPISFERLKYYGNKGEVVDLVNFVTFPANVPDIRDELCRGYGKRYLIRKGTLRKKAKEGVFYEAAAKRAIGKKGTGEHAFQRSQDEIEGLSRTNHDDELWLYELVIIGRLDGDEDDEERYLVTYDYENNELLQAMEYPYRVDFYALFRINERPNRLIGRSIPVKTRDLNDEVDTQHNQRINTRTIGSVPSFKADLSKKKDLDPLLKANKWKPGVIFWLPTFDAFEQFKVQPTDLGESMAEEQNDFKILDLYLGSAVSLLSGSTAPGDPSAPGNKTAIMIQQSNLRMDDPLSELRDGMEQLGEICLSHLYQFGPPILSYQAEVATANGMGRETRTIHKRFLRRGIRLKMRGVTVTQNPDTEMQKYFLLYQQLMAEPIFQQNPDSRIEVLRDALRAGRIPKRQKYLPSPQEIQAQQVAVQKQAMVQMQTEQAAAAQEATRQKAEAQMKQAQDELKTKNLANKIAEEALARNAGQGLETPPIANGAAQ